MSFKKNGNEAVEDENWLKTPNAMHDLEWVLVWKIRDRKDILGTVGETCIYLLDSMTEYC